jgi:hypothetical protein
MSYWYRVEETLIGSVDGEFGMAIKPRVKLCWREYPVITPKGFWLDLGYGDKKWVSNSAKKRWACPTKREAMESFKARKNRQIYILEAQLKRSKAAYQIIKQHIEANDENFK